MTHEVYVEGDGVDWKIVILPGSMNLWLYLENNSFRIS